MSVAAKSGSQFVRQAQAAFARGDYCDAEALFRTLCREDRYTPGWRLELATVLIAKIEFEAAEQALNEATSLAGGNTTMTRLVALAYFRMLQYDRAKRLLEPAASAGNEDSLLGLVQVLEREGSYEEAAEWVERALKARSPNPEFRYLEALLLNRQDNSDEAESRLRPLIESSQAPLAVRYKGAYLLAGILDRSERYNEAAEVLKKAKQELASAPAIKKLLKEQKFRVATFRELASRLRPEEIRRWRADVQGHTLAFRPAALMGHPRSGTTLLEHRLERHEEVVALEETNAFDGGAFGAAGFKREELFTAFYSQATERVKDARRRYGLAAAALHGKPLAPHHLVIDKNPSQLMQLALWFRLFPEIRLLVAIRDPRDVVISSYFLHLPPNPASAQFLDWEGTARHYADFMQLWLKMRETLPEDSWLECRYEDMVADAAAETARVAAFLGLAGKEKSPGQPSATMHSPNYATATRPVHSKSVARWRHYAEPLKPGLRLLEPYISEFGYPSE